MKGRRLKEKTPFFTRKKLLWATLTLCVCVMAGALGYLGRYYYQVYAQRNLEKNVNDLFEAARTGQTVNVPSPSDTEKSGPDTPPRMDGDGEDPAGESGEEETEWDRERRAREELVNLNREVYAAILNINADWHGQFSIPGLVDPRPYVRSWDNNEYLNRGFEGGRTPVGTVFLDAGNDLLMMDKNSVMHGHNVRAGAMFSKLLDYKRAAAFQRSPVVVLDGLVGESVWIVFAAYVTEPDWGYGNIKMDGAAFADLLAEISERSLFVTDVDVGVDDRILTLVTCDYTYEDMRFVVHARMLRPGEDVPESVTAVDNPDRKPFSIPSTMRLSEVKANRAAVMLHPSFNRLYFYQPRDGGIDRYTGNTSTVQGMYNSFTGRVAENSFLAAVYDPDPAGEANTANDNRRLYVAADNYNRQQGIHLFSTRLATGSLVYGGLATPAGVDARTPALIYDDREVWLLYTVVREGGEDIYRRLIRDGRASGDPELLLTAAAGSGARPLGLYTVDGADVLFWHEASNKTVRGAWEGGNPFTLALTGDADRVTFYGAVANNRIRAAVEKNGGFAFHNIELSSLPGPPAHPAFVTDPDPSPYSDPSPDPEPSPSPSPDETPDPDPTPSDSPPPDENGGEEPTE
ncbi:MAG: class B sortase [Oscillospiraceae bacterium]|nr:class B sortase [Oscillospiraceae bacterium]